MGVSTTGGTGVLVAGTLVGVGGASVGRGVGDATGCPVAVGTLSDGCTEGVGPGVLVAGGVFVGGGGGGVSVGPPGVFVSHGVLVGPPGVVVTVGVTDGGEGGVTTRGGRSNRLAQSKSQ